MVAWKLLEYIEDSGRSPFREWYNGLPVEVQAFVDDRLLVMRGLKRWPEKWVSAYKGNKGLFELRITHNKVQYRPFFCYGRGSREIVLLGGEIEKGGKIKRSSLDAFSRRLKGYVLDPRKARDYEFD